MTFITMGQEQSEVTRDWNDPMWSPTSRIYPQTKRKQLMSSGPDGQLSSPYEPPGVLGTPSTLAGDGAELGGQPPLWVLCQWVGVCPAGGNPGVANLANSPGTGLRTFFKTCQSCGHSFHRLMQPSPSAHSRLPGYSLQASGPRPWAWVLSAAHIHHLGSSP